MANVVKLPKVTTEALLETGYHAEDIVREKYGSEYMKMRNVRHRTERMMSIASIILAISSIALCVSAMVRIYANATSVNITLIISAVALIISIICTVRTRDKCIALENPNEFVDTVEDKIREKTGMGIGYSSVKGMLDLTYDTYHTHFFHELADYIKPLSNFSAEDYDDFELETEEGSFKVCVYGLIKGIRYGSPLEMYVTPGEFRKITAVDGVYDFTFIDDLYEEFVRQVESLREE